jgi:hypothetical protein
LDARAWSIREWLERYCEAKLSLKAPPSRTGGELEMLRLGMVRDPDEWRRSDGAGERLARFAHQEWCMSRLEPLERLVLVASVLPVGFCTVESWAWFADLRPVYTPLYELERGQCRAPTSSGHPCRLPRLFGEARCAQHRAVASRPVTYVRPGDGAEMVGLGEGLDADGGKLAEDGRRVRVVTTAPVYADSHYLAELLGVSVWAVREAGRRGRARLTDLLIEERIAHVDA